MIARVDDSTSKRVTVEIIQDDHSVESKVISFEDFLSILNGSFENSYDEYEIGKLPKGYYKGSLFPNHENSFKCTVVVPPGKFPVSYYGTIYTIPFPSLVFCFKVIKGCVNSSTCYAVKDDSPTDDTVLYTYPFGNVHSNGNICWGSNSLGDVRVLADIDRLVATFYGVPTNNDLFTPGDTVLRTESFVETLRSFYEHLNGKDDFPTNVLSPFGNLTLGQID